jgi:hypothetical protein
VMGSERPTTGEVARVCDDFIIAAFTDASIP